MIRGRAFAGVCGTGSIQQFLMELPGILNRQRRDAIAVAKHFLLQTGQFAGLVGGQGAVNLLVHEGASPGVLGVGLFFIADRRAVTLRLNGQNLRDRSPIQFKHRPLGVDGQRHDESLDGVILNVETNVLHDSGSILARLRSRKPFPNTLNAKRTSMDRAMISRLENGQIDNPSIKTMTCCAKTLGKKLFVSPKEAVRDQMFR